jgi:hypothetical protein
LKYETSVIEVRASFVGTVAEVTSSHQWLGGRTGAEIVLGRITTQEVAKLLRIAALQYTMGGEQ